MTDLIALIGAAIDETERIAKAASKAPWSGTGRIVWDAEHFEVADDAGWTGMSEVDVAHIVHNDPATVLRRCAADRKILELHRDEDGDCTTCRGEDEMQELYDHDTEQEHIEWISEPAPFPCATVLDRADAYGITGHSGGTT